ncbi:MAG: hypothetical protein SWH78_07770 [Thermodesulfobacteriota bacterium]|nr:hypothetical protein [Thermodesulfobacteriota bacterium]
MQKFLVIFVGVFLSWSLTVVAADTEGFFGPDGNPATAPAFDRIFAQAKEGGGVIPSFFQERMHGQGLERFLDDGVPAYVGWPHSNVQALVDRFFSEDFDPSPYTGLAEDGTSDTEGEDKGDLSLPFFSEEAVGWQAPPEDQGNGGLDAWMEQDWLWSPGASGGDTWYSPEGWGDTGQ